MPLFKKDVTVELLEGHLKRYGWQRFVSTPEPGEKEGVIMTGWSGGIGDDGFNMLIDPIVEKNAVNFKVGKVAEASPDTTPADRLNGLLLAMAALNYKLIIGKWAFDPRDGEVTFKLGVPIAAGKLEYEDFEQVMNALVAACEVDGRSLKAIIEGTKTAQEVIAGEGLMVGGGV